MTMIIHGIITYEHHVQTSIDRYSTVSVANHPHKTIQHTS